MRKEPINIIISCDRNGIALQKLSLYNLMKSNKDEDITIYFLNCTLSKENLEDINILVKKYSSFKFIPIHVDEKYKTFVNEIKINFNTVFHNRTIESVIRLCIPFIFPDMERCLWLDYDVFVIKPLKEIYDIELSSNEYFAAYEERVTTLTNVGEFIFKKYGLKHYINNGILLMNMEKMRKYMLLDNYLKISKKLSKHLLLQEQDLINILSLGCYKILPPQTAFIVCNNLAENQKNITVGTAPPPSDLEEIIFIHTCGEIKPIAKYIKNHDYPNKLVLNAIYNEEYL